MTYSFLRHSLLRSLHRGLVLVKFLCLAQRKTAYHQKLASFFTAGPGGYVIGQASDILDWYHTQRIPHVRGLRATNCSYHDEGVDHSKVDRIVFVQASNAT